jgi:hypothetical protein
MMDYHASSLATHRDFIGVIFSFGSREALL